MPAVLNQQAGGPADVAPRAGKWGAAVRPTSWPLGVSEPVNLQDAGVPLVRRSEVLLRARVSDSFASWVPAGRPCPTGRTGREPAMDVVHERCAGIDISKADVKVCIRVPGGGKGTRRRGEVRTFPAMTSRLPAMP